MTKAVAFHFSRNVPARADLVVALAAPDGKGIATAAAFSGKLDRAIKAERFSAKALTTLDVVAPEGVDADRLLLVGVGDAKGRTADGWIRTGGKVASLFRKATNVAVIADLPGVEINPSDIAELAVGARLRTYGFDAYKTKRDDDDDQPKSVKVTIVTASAAAAGKAFAALQEVAAGVELARDLVNRSRPAWNWRAIWSTNPPTSSVRWSSPPAPANWRRSASRSRY